MRDSDTRHVYKRLARKAAMFNTQVVLHKMAGWQRCLVLLLLVAITYVSSVEETMVPPDARNFNSQDWLMKRYKDGVRDSQKVYEDFERQVPHYCDPPNPCPLGYDSGYKGCDSSVLDTVQFNRDFMTSQQLRRLCPCDSEHDSCKDEERSGKVHTISSAFRLNRTQSYIADQATFQDVVSIFELSDIFQVQEAQSVLQ